LNVSAKDVKTGKEQRIVIKASSGLSEAEIKRMVGDAEAHAEEDKKFRELVGARNKADATIHTVEKALKDAGDKISDDEKKAAASAVAAVKTAMGGDDPRISSARPRPSSRLRLRCCRKCTSSRQRAPAPGAILAERAVTRKSLKMTCSMPSSKRSRKAIVRRPKAPSDGKDQVK